MCARYLTEAHTADGEMLRTEFDSFAAAKAHAVHELTEHETLTTVDVVVINPRRGQTPVHYIQTFARTTS